MKHLVSIGNLTTLGVVILASVEPCFGQGRVAFGNFSPALAPVTISTNSGTFNPGDGVAGAYVGSNYTASLFFVNGTITNQALFDSSSPIWFSSADTPFFGTTGVGLGHGDIFGDGSGFFDGGEVFLSAASSQLITIQVRVWYNGGGLFTSYAQAEAAAHNVGGSNPIPVQLAVGSQPAPNLVGLSPFTVGIVPEPSTFALAGLAGLLLQLFRCGKQSKIQGQYPAHRNQGALSSWRTVISRIRPNP